MEPLIAAITLEEVEQVIAQLHHGKFTGPGNLPNVWYKDFQTELAPILVRVYNDALTHGTVPA